MKKMVIKGVIVSFVFFMTLFIVSSIMNQGNADMTMEMGKASYPVIRVNYNGYFINEMHGYREPMEAGQMRGSITPLMEGRRISLEITPYGREIDQIAFEVRSLDGSRLVENTQVQAYDRNGENISLTFGLKDLIESNKEYLLVILLTLDNKSQVRYYTRVVSTQDYHADDKLDYVADFSNKTFDKEAARDLTKYMESNADGDNTTYGRVDIHSSFYQVTWGDLDVTRESRPQITIKELAPQTGSFYQEYYVSTPRGREKDYYKVKEFYRVRYTEDRMYLLDFERTMDQIFDAKGNVYANNKIVLGITSGEIQLKESDGGNNIAFITGGRLFAYNVADNKMALLFGFYDKDNMDERTLYLGHRIKILTVDEGGNVTFLVYGYMSRGSHEGNVGISVCYYDSVVNTVEEFAYIPCSQSQELLIEEVEQLSYINRNSMLYLKWRDRIYGVDVMSRICEVVVEDLAEGSYKVSDSNKMAVWQKGGFGYRGKELVLMNLTNGSQKSITAGAGEIIIPIGFMEEDLIYGLARERDVVRDFTGNMIFPMYCVKIENETKGVLKVYQQPDVYITDGRVSGNQIILSRVEKDEEGSYVPIKDDQVMNAETAIESQNKVETAVTEKYEKLTQIALKRTIASASMKHLTPREVLFEGSRNVTLEVSQETPGRYYVYGKDGLEDIYTDEGSAVNCADAISGVVVNEDGYYVWMKGNRSLKNQIMAIQGEMMTEEKNSLAVCLDVMLAHQGVVRNSEYMLNQGESVFDILRDSLPDAQILDLTGCSLDAVLYYVNRDIPVLVMMQDGSAVLLIGFNEQNTVIMNPETGTVYKVGMNDSREWFESNGNCFITYIKNEE